LSEQKYLIERGIRAESFLRDLVMDVHPGEGDVTMPREGQTRRVAGLRVDQRGMIKPIAARFRRPMVQSLLVIPGTSTPGGACLDKQAKPASTTRVLRLAKSPAGMKSSATPRLRNTGSSGVLTGGRERSVSQLFSTWEPVDRRWCFGAIDPKILAAFRVPGTPSLDSYFDQWGTYGAFPIIRSTQPHRTSFSPLTGQFESSDTIKA
jgi:hypothetical protein